MLIRYMREDDTKEISEIEKNTFSRPWSQDALIKGCNDENNVYLVVIKDDQIVGYGGFISVLDEAHITKIAVKEGYRRHGVGRILLSGMFDEARERGINSITLEVRRSNEAAIKLYERMGFEQTAIRKDFYMKPTEDAIIMWLRRLQ